MKRFSAVILLIAMLLLTLIFTVSCADDPNGSNPGGQSTPGNGAETGASGDDTQIKVPEYTDYGRGTVDFTSMTYSRPDFDSIIEKFNTVTAYISENSVSYIKQLDMIYSLEDDYRNVLGNAALAGIYAKADSTNSYWANEELFISTKQPSFSKSIEGLYVAAASSPHADRFSEDYFGEELFEYSDGGIYTDEVVALMEAEAALEADYNSLSTATVNITYGEITDTPEKILAYYAEAYGADSSKYLQASLSCSELYEAELMRISSELLVKLIKQRKLISNALGYDSYERYAYDTIYHDYTPEQIDVFIDDVTKYVIPVYIYLNNYVFAPYIHEFENSDTGLDYGKAQIINNLYDIFKKNDKQLGEIYSYMLQHSLYSIEAVVDNRFDGAFTTYIENYNAPFVFVTLSSSAYDYLTIAHEFGHFADSYINYNSTASLDTLEISSQAAELLAISAMNKEFDAKTAKYLSYSSLKNLFEVLIFQSFYARVESALYSLPYDAISVDSINKLVADTAKSFGLSSAVNNIEYVLTPHIILYPFYVQSYPTSAAVAAEIYCKEINEPGKGFEIYGKLIDRHDDENCDFESLIKNAGLTSPFKRNSLKDIADTIYYSVMGAHYFTDYGSNVA